MLALGLRRPVARQVLAGCLEAGLIVNAVGDDTIRMLPPLVITEGDVDTAVEILGKVMATEV
jgi:4-aminobutyrate aminotransferase-like enzyme